MRKCSQRCRGFPAGLMYSIKDDTVPYPSAAIDTVDHFTEWADQGIQVECHKDGIMQSWHRQPYPDLEVRKSMMARKQKQKKGWTSKLGTLPPVLRYSYPYNYVCSTQASASGRDLGKLMGRLYSCSYR